jgi:YidC/Oxa1 family membrane protein insertase
MDKKVFLAVTICAGIFLLWQNYYIKPYTDRHQAWVQQQQAQQKSESGATAPNSQSANPAVNKDGASKLSASNGSPTSAQSQNISLGDNSYTISISTHGGIVSSVAMSDYRGKKPPGNLAQLIGNSGQLQLSTPATELAYLTNVNYSVQSKGKDSQGLDHLVLAYDDANVAVERSYTVNPGLFVLDHTVKINFKKQAPAYLFIGSQVVKQVPKAQQENERRQVVFNRAGGQKTWAVNDIDEVKEDLGEGNWMGFSSRYFLNALADNGFVIHPQFQARPIDGGEVTANLIYKLPGASVQIPVRMYYGPKEIDTLKAAGKHLDAAVDFGWFTIFAYPMLSALKWFYKYVHNFGLAIILLTVLVKLITYPLTLKSMKSMKEMQRIQPQLARLRERHKDDKEKLNQEMMQLMRANGYNPMSGCLPMFIQMPIFIALYNVLYGAIDLYGQPFFGWIHDLSAKDPLYVTPALLALMMFLQQKVTPNTTADPAQQRMMMFMPLVFGFMMLWLPSGLTLYMLVNSVVSVAQQFWINRNLGMGASAGAAA